MPALSYRSFCYEMVSVKVKRILLNTQLVYEHFCIKFVLQIKLKTMAAGVSGLNFSLDPYAFDRFIAVLNSLTTAQDVQLIDIVIIPVLR